VGLEERAYENVDSITLSLWIGSVDRLVKVEVNHWVP
jgi:hypothetical protein